MNHEDRLTISEVMLEMIKEQVTDPLTTLLDQLIINLLVNASITPEILSQSLVTATSSMSEEQKDSLGYRIIERYVDLFAVLADGAVLSPECASDQHSGRQLPGWVTAVIEGGKSGLPHE
ncbi:MAG: hypothetical protein R8M38_01700 [Mariprofundaceae bacterium]